MKIKLIDIDDSNGREEETGTCELCFGTQWCNNPVFIFEDEKGKQFNIDGYWWEWGDYFELYIDNAIKFDEWLRKQDYPGGTKFDEDWLYRVVEKYNGLQGKDVEGY